MIVTAGEGVSGDPPGDLSGGSSGDAVHAGLAALGAMPGLVTACLVEAGTGHVLDTVPGSGPELLPSVVGAGAGDVVQALQFMAASLGDPDELEDVIVTFGRHHHLVRPLPGAGVDGLLIVVTLDRAVTNLALARRQLRGVGVRP